MELAAGGREGEKDKEDEEEKGGKRRDFLFFFSLLSSARLFHCSIYSVPYMIYSSLGMPVCLPLFHILIPYTPTI